MSILENGKGKAENQEREQEGQSQRKRRFARADRVSPQIVGKEEKNRRGGQKERIVDVA